MAISNRVQSGQEKLLQIARLHGENLSQRAFGERGPDLQVTLADLEQFLQPIVAAIASGFLAASAEEQTQRLGEDLPKPELSTQASVQKSVSDFAIFSVMTSQTSHATCLYR